MRQVASVTVIVMLAVAAASWPTPATADGADTHEGDQVGEPSQAGGGSDGDDATSSAADAPEPNTVALTDEEIPVARTSFSDKWQSFTDAARGLLVWDFFDGRLTIRSHVRVMFDGTTGWGNDRFGDSFGIIDDAIDIRRLSFVAQGTVDHHIRYSASFNFGADGGLGEAFIEGREEGLSIFGYRVGQFRLGFFQEPFTFERVESSYYTSFLERSLPIWTFSPGSNLGYMLFDQAFNERMQWAVGFFSFGQGNEANSSDSTLSLSARVTGLPVYRDNGRRLFHVGASFSTRDPKEGTVRYKSRPEARFVDFLVDTGDIEAGRIQLAGIEAVAMNGPLHVQAEVVASRVQRTEYGDLDLWGAYVEAGWFITGEHRSYDTKLGTFSRMVPRTDYSGGLKGLLSRNKGGGFELVGRVSKVDLDDGELRGGEMTNLSVGLNWYLDPTSTVKLNYINSSVRDRGRANILLLRYQFRPLPVPGWR
jgi:phosphate-selective porin OprO/OprP